MIKSITNRSDYTFKYNEKLGRYGWLRLTPAYSVKLVDEIITGIPKDSFILEPFSGTATTGLVAAEKGVSAHCLDINQFLKWLGNAKCRNYTNKEFELLSDGINAVMKDVKKLVNERCWIPDIYNIERWWCGHTLKILGGLRQALVNEFGELKEDSVSSLAWIAFCRLIIETSSAAFNHVSMSFSDNIETFEVDQIESLYLEILEAIIQSAKNSLKGTAKVYEIDSRNITSIDNVEYSHVVTSPPYPNRISYIRELRPYMYWTKFLETAREAGEIDWKAIGGTWGIATSRLQDWNSNGVDLPESLIKTVTQIRDSDQKNSLLMSNYVWKYFHDMHLHFISLKDRLRKGAQLAYIMGNSSFYGNMVHTETLIEDSLLMLGFNNIGSKVVRKRNSKKELFEYYVYATWKEKKVFVPAYFEPAEKAASQIRLAF